MIRTHRACVVSALSLTLILHETTLCVRIDKDLLFC